MNSKPIPINEIKKLADDIRLIKDFSENHNFDASLISAKVEPNGNNVKQRDWPVICAVIFTFLLILVIGTLNFWENLPPAASKFVFAIGLLWVVLTSISMHKKFENTTITLLAFCGLVAVLLIGAGVLTPKEAVSELQKFKQK